MVFKHIGQTQSLFIYLRPYLNTMTNIVQNLTLLGIGTLVCRMVGTDESTEPWWPCNSKCLLTSFVVLCFRDFQSLSNKLTVCFLLRSVWVKPKRRYRSNGESHRQTLQGFTKKLARLHISLPELLTDHQEGSSLRHCWLFFGIREKHSNIGTTLRPVHTIRSSLHLIQWTAAFQRQKIYILSAEMQSSVAGCSRFSS